MPSNDMVKSNWDCVWSWGRSFAYETSLIFKRNLEATMCDFLFWALREKWRRRENLQPWHVCEAPLNQFSLFDKVGGGWKRAHPVLDWSHCKTTQKSHSYRTNPTLLIPFLGAVREEGLKNFFTVVTLRVFSLVFFSSNLENVARECWEWDCGGWVWEELWLLT